MNKVQYFLPFFFISFISLGYSQQTITGKVIDEATQEPLAGVTVFVKSSKIGTVTDVDGFYTLDRPNGSDSLVIESVGYLKNVVAIGHDVMNIQLKVDPQVIVCYEIVSFQTNYKRRQLIPKEYFQATNFNRGPIHDPLQLLRGKAAGVEITRGGNDPNEPFVARIRGTNTYYGDNRPTILINGVPNTSLLLLDPTDIAGVDVIKDGAQYGMRGLQGVLNFETKKDNYNGGFNYSTSITTERLIRPMQVMTPLEFINKGGTDFNSKTDWRSLVTQNALTYVHNLAWSKRFKNTDLRLSSHYRKAEGVIKKSGFEQFNGRFNINQRLFHNKLILTANAALTSRNAQLANSYIYQQAHSFNPTAPIYDPKNTANGGYFEIPAFDNYNPLSILEQTWSRRNINAYSGNLKAEWEIIPDLKAITTVSHENQADILGQYYGKTAYNIGAQYNGQGNRTHAGNKNNYINASINYEKNMNSWRLKSRAGYEFQKFQFKNKTLKARDYDRDINTLGDISLGKFNVYDSLLLSENTKSNTHTLIGFYGHAEADFENIFFFSLGYRHDGSSRLGINEKWIAQPSASAGVDFARLFNLYQITTLKGRLGYSTTSAAPFDANLTQRTYRFYNNELNIDQLENPNLAPEVKREWNAGLDFNILGERFYGSLEVYKNKVSDIISPSYNAIPGFSFSNIWSNTATLQNKGVELTLRSVPVKRKITWETILTMNHNESRFLSFKREGLNYSFNGGGLNSTLPFRTGVFTWGCPEGVKYFKEGEKIGSFIGPHFVSVDNNQFIMREEPDVWNGGYSNEVVIGNAFPKFTMAWSNNVQYKKFDLNFVVRSVVGHDILNEYRGFYEGYSGFFNQVITKYTIPGYKGFIPFSDRSLEKGNFVKLDNITLGYVLNNVKFIKQLRLYISADNLLILTRYSGSDPEPRYTYAINNYASPNNYLTGVDGRKTYPLSRSFTFGVNVRF